MNVINLDKTQPTGMKLGSETGSVVNYVQSGSQQPIPVVGMAATMLGWTDRVAGTVVKVTKCQVHVQRDKSVRMDNNGMSENQEYSYERDPDGDITVYRMTKRGWKSNSSKTGLLLGIRDEHYDYSF
jgi:hypothetical protein